MVVVRTAVVVDIADCTLHWDLLTDHNLAIGVMVRVGVRVSRSFF
jgi:hypothetical protein